MSGNDTPVHDDFMESLLGDFLDESAQLLDRLNENMLRLDEWVRALDDDEPRRHDPDLMNEMFRAAHSLKGLSAMLGLKDINSLTHKVENVFDAARKDQLAISPEVVETVFQAIDRLVAMVDGLKNPEAEAVEVESVLGEISRILQAAGAERAASSQADAEKALAALASLAAAPTETATEAPAAAEAAPATTAGLERQETPAPQAEPIRDPLGDLVDEAELSGKYTGIFIDETDRSLDSLTETLLALEGGGNHAALESLMVTAHRIKGSAASVGYHRAAKLSHIMEDLLQRLLAGRGTLGPELADAMLKAADGLRTFVAQLRKGVSLSDNFGPLAIELIRVQSSEHCPSAAPEAKAATSPTTVPASTGAASKSEAPAAKSAAPPAAASLPAELFEIVAHVAPESATTWVGRVTFQDGLALANLKAQLIFEKLFGLGSVCYFDPPPERLDTIDGLGQVSFGVATDRPREAWQQQLWVAGVTSVELAPLRPETSADAPAAEPAMPAPPPATTAAKAPAPARPAQAPAQPAPTPAKACTPKAPPCPPAAAVKPAAAAPAPTAGASKAEKTADAAKPAGDASGKPTETLRVDIDRLDELMNLAGQLVINKARFTQIGERLKTLSTSRQSTQLLAKAMATLDGMASGDSNRSVQSELDSMRVLVRRLQGDLEVVQRDMAALADARGAVGDLCEAVHQLDRVSDGIQTSVMNTRMVPIGPLFTRFRRVVRDITRANGKSIRLEICGEKTELDKRMIDELGDPLIHMVRNSADHGIEPPEQRLAAGKPAEGVVTLDAFHRGNSIVIQVKDDGKGLDSDRILRKAIERGMVAEAEAGKLTKRQIYNLIWEPGLSTAEKVTEVSGRGMGMDIVKSKIEELNGSIDLDSELGRGTTITIKLPLTLAILPSLMVELEGDIFALPIESIVEIVSIGRNDVTTVHGRPTACVRGRVVSVVELESMFLWNCPPKCASTRSADETNLVIIGDRGREIGLAVDRVLGEEDIVIKSVAENYRNVQGVAGASILGDGRVALILDVGALLDLSTRKAAAAANC